MTTQDDIAELQRRLAREGLGPVAAIANEATEKVFRFVRDGAQALRQAVYDKPFITCLMSFEVGFALGRLGRIHASR